MLAHGRRDGDTFCNDQGHGVDGHVDWTRLCRVVVVGDSWCAACTDAIAHCARECLEGCIDDVHSSVSCRRAFLLCLSLTWRRSKLHPPPTDSPRRGPRIGSNKLTGTYLSMYYSIIAKEKKRDIWHIMSLFLVRLLQIYISTYLTPLCNHNHRLLLLLLMSTHRLSPFFSPAPAPALAPAPTPAPAPAAAAPAVSPLRAASAPFAPF
jgi:hypothetical protein